MLQPGVTVRPFEVRGSAQFFFHSHGTKKPPRHLTPDHMLPGFNTFKAPKVPGAAIPVTR